MMAGFGGGQAEKPKETPKSLTSGEAVARTALKEYNDLKREGGVVAQVYARQKDTDDEWLPVGYVSTPPPPVNIGKIAFPTLYNS